MKDSTFYYNHRFTYDVDSKIIHDRPHPPLCRIKALYSFGNVKEGDLGGWVSYNTISLDDYSKRSWVYGNAKVFNGVEIYDNATVINDLEVRGDFILAGNSVLSNQFEVMFLNAVWYDEIHKAQRLLWTKKIGPSIQLNAFICGKDNNKMIDMFKKEGVNINKAKKIAKKYGHSY